MLLVDHLEPWKPAKHDEEVMRSGSQQSTEQRMGGSLEENTTQHQESGRSQKPEVLQCFTLACLFFAPLYFCGFCINVLYMHIALYSTPTV